MGLLLLVLLALGISYVWTFHSAVAARLESLEPRYARLLGLEASRPRLEAADAAARAAVAEFTYAGTQDASQAGNDAQQKIRAVFTDAKLDIVSSQVLPPKADGDMERVPVSVRAEGELRALQTALIGIAGQTPAILIDRMTIQGSSYIRPDATRLTVQFSFSVLRARS
ncbi:type II secretion system protein GspM [Xylophilus ampelinus]|uniref:General secretion pathway protein M n=1 Tax=Xylophilus ampelinus TaxID=54067 RepID=A0A318SJV5_9BURK|nr:type II secretion system protein GspM [Xylophilus ampelinus]PYE76031.1 general secretion pathway protein M [Xylophilus ampelinus]